MLIVLTGIDGSGKTTAANALVSGLQLGGTKALLLSNHAARRRLSLLSAKYGWQLPPRVADAIETTVRIFNVLVSHVRAHRFGGTVVMDRHLYCQLALRKANGLRRGILLPWLLERLPEPDLVIYFDVDPQHAYQRVLARGTDKESLRDLQDFRAAYRSLPEYSGFVEVDANGTPGEVLERLSGVVAAAGMPVPAVAGGTTPATSEANE
ncbi:thymidylate kinase [Paenarthrobacter sp. NPDC089322]|uniref:dTMP kinase n=1 Tax=Paenarthrobacter sp. NPDC089322 TaxID=3155065 RepID=UPI003441935D